MAIENIIGAELRRRWIIAALFGLVHGFGFADILKEQLQFAGSYLLVSLVSFNIGIEIGQLLVLCVFVPALALLFRGKMAGRMGIIVLSAIVANVAWQWMMERGEVLWQTPWPQPTAAGLMVLARWALALGGRSRGSEPPLQVARPQASAIDRPRHDRRTQVIASSRTASWICSQA